MEEKSERKRIGEMLEALRKSNNMTQTELSALTGMKQISISRIESGLFDMKVETVAKILKVFNKQIGFIEIV